jgi:hypothetical protein
MRKFYAFILAALMVVGLSAAVYAEDGVPETYGGYQVVTVSDAVNFAGGAAAVSAFCPDETWRVTSGGYFISGTVRAVVVDNRGVDEPTADRWHVTAFSQAGSTVPTTAVLTVQVVCTKLG